MEQEARFNNLQRTLLGGGLGFSLLVIGFGFYGIPQEMKRNKLKRDRKYSKHIPGNDHKSPLPTT